jgi:hypothetical protein
MPVFLWDGENLYTENTLMDTKIPGHPLDDGGK